MSSVQPIAGAQYHWTHYLAPAGQRRFITWVQGRITWFAQVSLLAGVANTTAYMIQSLAVVNCSTYVAERWHVTLIIFALLIVEGISGVPRIAAGGWEQLQLRIANIRICVLCGVGAGKHLLPNSNRSRLCSKHVHCEALEKFTP